ncbi:MAG TPA: hypothetical protein VMU09_09380 [Acidimicrobiales bacterium]|nr:hypothetical protein [Acidimicrobiales bacterium]
MTVTDTARALEAMKDDEEVRGRLAAGDFSDVEGFDLTGEERSLLHAGAADFPEVEGFLNPQPLPPMPDPGFADGSRQLLQGPGALAGLSPFARLNAYVGGAGGGMQGGIIIQG